MTTILTPQILSLYANYSADQQTNTLNILSFLLLLVPCPASIQRGRGLHDKHAPGLLMDSSAVICMSKATCCRSERGYPARIPGIPIPNGKPIFRVLAGSFLMRFRSGPGFSESPGRDAMLIICCISTSTYAEKNSTLYRLEAFQQGTPGLSKYLYLLPNRPGFQACKSGAIMISQGMTSLMSHKSIAEYLHLPF